MVDVLECFLRTFKIGVGCFGGLWFVYLKIRSLFLSLSKNTLSLSLPNYPLWIFFLFSYWALFFFLIEHTCLLWETIFPSTSINTSNFMIGRLQNTHVKLLFFSCFSKRMALLKLTLNNLTVTGYWNNSNYCHNMSEIGN